MAKTVIQIIASALAKQYKLSAADGATFVDTFFAIISDELKKGNQVKIKGLGTFKVQRVKPRESVNVNTGERVLIEGHDKVSFTPDAAMKELVNKPFSQFETVVINDGVDTKVLEKIPTEEENANADSNSSEDVPNVVEEKGQLEIEEEEKVSEVEDSKDELVIEQIPDTSNAKVEKLVDDKPNIEKVETEQPKSEPKQDKDNTKEYLESSDSNIESYVDNKENSILKLVAVIAIIVIACLGVVLWIKFGGINLSKPTGKVAIQQVESPKKKVDNAVKVIQKDNKSDTTIIKKVEKRDDSYAEMNNDARIRYGAYNIVGVERVIVLRKGQTMASISRKTLGADMIGYFQVLNGRNSMKAGDTLKIPRVELRPEYRSK